MAAELDGRVLDALFAVVEERKGASPDDSYTAKLLAAGAPKIARKVGEEAVEVVVAALAERDKLAAESADLLYHLLVLWADAGVRPEEVWTELARRQGTSGLAEKASRGRNVGAG